MSSLSKRNAVQLMIACQLATLAIAGVVTTIGLVVPAAAAQYGVEITTMAAQFTWFTGAGLVGQLVSFVIFDYFAVKRVLLLSHLLCAGALVLLHMVGSFSLLSLWFSLFGVFISTAICGSSTLITQLWQGPTRQAALVAQDAMFNGGGVVFAAVTGWVLAQNLPYSTVYMATVAVLVTAFLLVAVSQIPANAPAPDQDAGVAHTEWNARIILIGISLLLFMLAKLTIFIWAPQFISASFPQAPDAGGAFMSNVFSAALVGSIAGAALVARVSVRYLVYGFVLLSLLAAGFITRLEALDAVMMLGFVYGVSVSATFNAYVAFALTQVANPTHRNIAYMLLMSSLGSSLAPLLSSQVVALTGAMQNALTAALIMLLVVVLSLIGVEVLSWRQRQPQSVAAPNGQTGG